MHKDGIDTTFSGGEIDPETGELTLYKTNPGMGGGADNTGELSGMPSVWSGVRLNPLLGGLGMESDGSYLNVAEDDTGVLCTLMCRGGAVPYVCQFSNGVSCGCAVCST